MVEWTKKQFARQVECAREAGIYNAMFLAFGSLLGHVRSGGIVSGDDDMDVGFISEMITREQELEYIRLIGLPTEEFPGHGLYEYRRESAMRYDSNRPFWLSIRGRPHGECFRCCHWFFWDRSGYTWHCKGAGTLVKGLRSGILTPGEEVEFLGTMIRIPKFTGAALDAWYPDWVTPRSGGNSSKKILMNVTSWQTMSGTINETNLN